MTEASASSCLLLAKALPTVLLGDFNIDLMQANTEQKALMKYLITGKGYTQLINQYLITGKGYAQLINQYTTDYCTQINHVPQIMCTISR